MNHSIILGAALMAIGAIFLMTGLYREHVQQQEIQQAQPLVISKPNGGGSLSIVSSGISFQINGVTKMRITQRGVTINGVDHPDDGQAYRAFTDWLERTKR